MLVIADTLPGHILRGGQERGPGQVLPEDVPHRAGLLGVGLDQPVPDHIAEWDFSLPCHGSHQPFGELQPVQKPELHFLS